MVKSQKIDQNGQIFIKGSIYYTVTYNYYYYYYYYYYLKASLLHLRLRKSASQSTSSCPVDYSSFFRRMPCTRIGLQVG